jgi:hypothetical protein
VGKGKAERKTNLDSKTKLDREVVSICQHQRKAMLPSDQWEW